MREMILWLRSIELLASNLYLEAACNLTDDPKFSSFLSRMSTDETWHYHVIGSAAHFLLENDIHLKSAIQLDVDLKQEVEIPFHELSSLLSKHKLTRKKLVDIIVKAEFSELNRVFLYVVTTLAEISSAFQHVAATIETHKKRIVKFLENIPEGREIIDKNLHLPRIWNEKILVVEDLPAIRNILSETLKSFAEVHTAADGQAGLELLKNNFFNAVVSDIAMPRMGGIEFYQKAVALNSNFKRNFLFISGDITPEIGLFMRTNNLICLEKPFSLKQLAGLIQEVMDKTM
jgi:CheY-like chemotaxis protein